MLITIEHGDANPSIATLLRISDALGVGLPVLVDVERPRALSTTAAGEAPVTPLARTPTRFETRTSERTTATGELLPRRRRRPQHRESVATGLLDG